VTRKFCTRDTYVKGTKEQELNGSKKIIEINRSLSRIAESIKLYLEENYFEWSQSNQPRQANMPRHILYDDNLGVRPFIHCIRFKSMKYNQRRK